MSRETFHNLLKRYLEGNCTEQEKRIVEQWYGMLDDGDLPDIHASELSVIDEKLWAAVNARINPLVQEQQQTNSSIPVRSMWVKLAVAASLVGILAFCAYWINFSADKSDLLVENSASAIKRTNTSAAPLEIMLEDGSQVILQPNAELTYPTLFNKSKREVFVKGEAFFQVSKDQSRPFYVFSTNLITQVVGTSFIVKADDTAENEVTVLTGKVIVSKNEDKNFYKNLFSIETNKVVLTPNQMVTFHQETKKLIVSLVKNPAPIVSEKEESEKINFVFNDTPLSTVLITLEKTYGIEINTENEEINNCTFTGDIKDQDMYTKLELICQSVGATYEIEETEIRITGGKCN